MYLPLLGDYVQIGVMGFLAGLGLTCMFSIVGYVIFKMVHQFENV